MAMSNKMPDLALLADMGTGKTGAMVNILRLRYGESKRVQRTIILSPLVTLLNWRDEILKHSYIDPDKIVVLIGTSVKKLRTFEKLTRMDQDKIVILNYEGMISNNIVQALSKWRPEIAVLDESHYCKSHKAKRSKAVYDLVQDCTNRYIMTGTPVTNDLPDIFMQYKILDGGETFGSNYYVFQRKYMYDENQAWSHKPNHFPKWVMRPELVDTVNSLIYDKAIRVTKSECLDLPPVVEETYKVPLSPKQKKYYEQMERDFVTFVEEGESKGIAVAQLAMTKALRLQQIVTGFIVDEDGEVIEIEDNPRLIAVKELVQALHVKRKVILWCSFRHNYKQLGKLMESMKIEHRFITGSMTLPQKQEAMDDFKNDDNVRVMIANRKAGGIGVNLVSASASIIYSRNFSLEEELQSRDRNYRGGSEIHNDILRINLCAEDTVDERTTEALISKEKISDDIINFIRRR
jgi:SNF2 family DNA or RNA helicase